MAVPALAQGYRAGAFTPLDVCRQALERLRAWEPRLNAFIDPMPDEVLRQAEQATRELAAAEDKGPLHGIPVAIKDIIDVAGTTSPASANCCRPS